MRRTALLGIAAASLWASITWQRFGLQPSALTLELALLPVRFGSVIHSWSPEQLATYRSTLLLDLGFVVAYGAFGYSAAKHSSPLQALPRTARRFAAWLLPSAASANLVQDALLGWLTEAPRFGVPVAYYLAFALAAAKLALVAAFGLLVALAYARTEA